MKHPSPLLLCLAALSLPAAFALPAASQQPLQHLSASELIRRADTLTDLREPGSAPFHLHGTFEASGPVELTGSGTYDETWLSPELWRVEVSLAGYHATWGSNAHGLYKDESDPYRPSRVELLIDVLHRSRQAEEIKDKDWAVSQEGDGSTMLTRRPRGEDKFYKTALSLNGSGVPVVKVNNGSMVRSGAYVTFHGKYVPHLITLQVGENSALSFRMTTLEAAPEGAANDLSEAKGTAATPCESVPLLGENQKVSTGKMRPPKLTFEEEMRFPAEDRAAVRAGLSSMQLFVDQEGRPRDVETKSATRPEFAKNALEAIRRYRFRPSTLDGRACQMMIYVEANFRTDH